MACPNTGRPQSLVAQCNPSLSADLGRAHSAAAAAAQHMHPMRRGRVSNPNSKIIETWCCCLVLYV